MAETAMAPAPGRARMSIRRRLALLVCLFGAAVLAAEAFVIARVAEQQEEDFIDDTLAAVMDRLAAGGAGAPVEIAPQGRLRAYVADTPNARLGVPGEFRDLPDGTHEVTIDGVEHHVAVRRQGGAAFYLSYDVSRHEERIREFRSALAAILAGAVLTLVALSVWLSGVLSREVRDLAEEVRYLEPGTAGRPLAGRYRDREVHTLALALDEYARRVVVLLAREKEFTANVSHELRTPLTTIRTGAEMLTQDAALSARSRDRARAIVAGADHIAELIDALLLLGRETPIEAEDVVDVAELAEETAAPLRPAAEARGLRLAIDVAPGTVVRANRPALQLTLANLLKNALAYTDRGEVRVHYAHGMLAVSDTGTGMSPSDLPRIFERAFRGANARTGGTGIGLAIVKRIADRFGWTIAAESEADRGTTVRIALR